MSVTLHELAVDLGRQGREAVTLSMPELFYRSINASERGPCLDWCGEVLLTDLASDDSAPVRGGAVEFLTIRLGEEPVASVLDSYSSAAEHFAGLFDGCRLADDVQEQFDAMVVNDALIVLDVFVAEPLRGRRVAAWAVSEIAYRMLPAINGIVLLAPGLGVEGGNDIGMRKLTRYWRRTGLHPDRGLTGVLGPVDRLHVPERGS